MTVALLLTTLGVIRTPYADDAVALLEMGLEELMQVEIYSAGKKIQTLSDISASVYVLKREDIIRSGARTLPEALRLVPGVQVARINASHWAISIRGFNNRYANKLLVLMDGRSIYSPLHGGIYWEMQDTLLDEIEAIEVIRGPGGTVWGANAINGIINIRTRHAEESQGGWVKGVAAEKEYISGFRYGGKLDKDIYYRVYAKTVSQTELQDDSGAALFDDSTKKQLGFKANWQDSGKNRYVLEGNAFNGKMNQQIGQTSLLPVSAGYIKDVARLSTRNVSFKWQRDSDADSGWEVQSYFDEMERREAVSAIDVHTVNVDLQHHFNLTSSQVFTWGLGARDIKDHFGGTFTLSMVPEDNRQQIYSAFIQDEFQIKDEFKLVLGTKIDHNDFTGMEYQPSIRGVWSISDDHMLWGALSRSVREPTRAERGIRINIAASDTPQGPVLVSILSNPDFDSEDLVALEFGYRGQPSKYVSLDVAVYYHKYSGLYGYTENTGFEATPSPPHFLVSRTFGNLTDGRVLGMDVFANWKIIDDWRLKIGYNGLNIDLEARPGSVISQADDIEGTSPKHQVQIQSYYSLTPKLEINSFAFYNGKLRSANVPGYTRLDLQLGWELDKHLHLSFGGQNLLKHEHKEFESSDVKEGVIARQFYINTQWSF